MIIHTLGDKTNFVDANNVLVGWDTGQSCCETATWWIADEKDAPEPLMEDRDATKRDLSAYVFHANSLYERKPDPERGEYTDDGGSIAFRLIAQNLPDLWLVLNNSHNGYYSHGFNIDIGGKTIWEGSL